MLVAASGMTTQLANHVTFGFDFFFMSSKKVQDDELDSANTKRLLQKKKEQVSWIIVSINAIVILNDNSQDVIKLDLSSKASINITPIHCNKNPNKHSQKNLLFWG